jgi:hypothetical protein
LQDRSVMDILGAREDDHERPADGAPAGSSQSANNFDRRAGAEWIKLAIDIEEIQ